MSEHVLIVDDSLTVRMDLADAFSAAGFSTIPCETVSAARMALAVQPIDAVVLDVLLPDGDGVAFLKELRASRYNQDLLILMLSSEAEVKDRILGLKTGADEYVGKPYDSGYIVSKVRERLGARKRSSTTKATVLLIDDSITFREELKSALEGNNYDVLVAANGEDGLRAAVMQRPSAIIIDGLLPGIDGPSVIRRIRLDSALRSVPCILLTGSGDHRSELKALEAGADAFVKKDENSVVVLAKLGAILRRTAGQALEDVTGSLLGPKRILAVDDSLTYLHILGDVLRAEGYDVVLARSGEEALDLLAIQNVDCILLDLLMPGLNGEETCKRIKAAHGIRDIPLIMLTALEDRDAMIRGLSSGADDYISKSNETTVLTARVRVQLRRKQFEDENRRIREELLQKELEAAEARAARELADTRTALVDQLERKNNELEAFCYSVSHDLRAPLRSIDGFCQALLEDYAQSFDETATGYFNRVRAAAQRMGELIDDLLDLSRVARIELTKDRVNMSALAKSVADELQRNDSERSTAVMISESPSVEGDRRLLRILLENLLGNAWKFTSKSTDARIEFGVQSKDGAHVFFVRDNGAGFNMAYAEKLFHPFQRLHTPTDFPGTGIGLATVARIVDRHHGKVWAEGVVGKGATIYFTISNTQPEKQHEAK